MSGLSWFIALFVLGGLLLTADSKAAQRHGRLLGREQPLVSESNSSVSISPTGETRPFDAASEAAGPQKRAARPPGSSSPAADVSPADDELLKQLGNVNRTVVGSGKPRIVFGIKSGASFKEYVRRQQWRNSTCSQTYAEHNIAFKFFLGMPYSGSAAHPLDKHDPNRKNTTEEMEDARRILKEAQENNDIVLLPLRDQYMSLPEKTFSLLKFSSDSWPQTPYIGTHDIEYCVRPEIADREISQFEAQKGKGGSSYDQLYAGWKYWRAGQLSGQIGPNGTKAPYLDGRAYYLSSSLISTIVREDHDHSVMWANYGTSAEDANVGKWVQYAEQHHSGMKTLLVEQTNLVWEVRYKHDK